ncbi:MAG TPA: glycosyl hydrolase family 65 protein, partial [Gemmataceae bacterium]|nr:glycosyl hydrolase family 65 protein [Gemmataceae bacterium]
MRYLIIILLGAAPASAQVLDKQKLLEAQSFWDNRDWDWYADNIPFFECPDADITTTYYYRWEVVTKHLTYGSPNSGYSFTEFIDRPFWSGAYGAISCPAGHQLYEVRWLRDPRIARDYARYWFRTPGAEPRRYSTWLADAVWAVHRVHPDDAFVKDLLPDLVKNHEGWEKRHFVPAVGLFWQTGHDDGMEININSRQTKDTVRGAPGFRPTLNSYLWADALAIARVAELAGDRMSAAAYRDRAAKLKDNLQKKLWDPKRSFFLHMAKDDEERDGHTVKALSLTYQTGKHAGSPHGREEIGYVPWQFGLPDRGYEAAWKFLMDRDYFFADYGPTTVERKDPLFALSKTCCWWSGQSWPYATTQTLKAMTNLLQDYGQDFVTRADYLKLLQVYAKSHRKDGKPYIAEACHPDTGSWEGHDSFNHSEHYFHSGYTDLIITGLVGLRTRDDDTVEVNPLAPREWDYFALDDVPYRGHRLSIVWDREGRRYGLGKGLHVLADGKKLASAERLQRLTAELPPLKPVELRKTTTVNFAVNNDGGYYPRA